MAFKKVKQEKNDGLSSFSSYKSLNDGCMPYILNILLKIKSLLLFLANGRAC